MARLLFPDDATAQRLGAVPGAYIRNAFSAPAIVYTDAAGTQLADILALNGTPVAGSQLVVDAVTSRLPVFYGPDGVDTLYVRIDGGPVAPLYARVDDRIDLLGARSARSDLGIYVPPGWGSAWRTKLAQAKTGTGKAVLTALGGSSTQGYFASRLDTKAWIGLLRSSLQASYGDGGSGFYSPTLSPTFQANANVPAGAQSAYAAAGDLATVTGTWQIPSNNYGPGNLYIYTQVANATYTATVRGSTVRIYTVAGSTNHTNWTYSIDGAAAVTVIDVGGASQQIQVTTITGLTSGSHQVVLTFTGDTTKFVSLAGLAGENSGGVVVNNQARYGSRTAMYADADTTLSMPYYGASGYPADLLILTHGPNDANNGDSGDAWARSMRKLMTNAREYNPDIALAIVLPHVGSYESVNLLYQDYASRARGLAEAFGAAFVDFWAIGKNSWKHWQNLGYWSNSATPGTAGNDQVHPSDAGHKYIADTLLPILTN